MLLADGKWHGHVCKFRAVSQWLAEHQVVVPSVFKTAAEE